MPAVFGFIGGALGIGAASGLAGAAAGAAFAGTFVGGVLVNLATSVALSALSAAIAGKPKAPPPVGLRTQHVMTGGVNPESFILGRYATSGAFACPPLSQTGAGSLPNGFLTYVIELAGTPGHQIETLILNGESVEILDPAPEGNPNRIYGNRIGGRYLDHAWIRYYDGSQTAADEFLLERFPAPHVRPWSADMVGAGICYAVVTFFYNREIYQGWPQCRFVMTGLPLYDPRADSSVGGTGAQRWNDPATWAPSENAALQVYNVLRGINLPGGWVWGGGIAAEDLPYAVWALAMDRCDALVDDGDGGTEPAYRAGFEIMADDEPFEVIDELLRACAGAVAESGGVWTIRVGGPALPVLFITDDDILADAPEEFTPFPALDEVYNGISGTYIDPDTQWESRDAAPIYNAEWEAEDGGRRLMATVQLAAVHYPVQVERLMAALIKDHRRMIRHVITLPQDAFAVEGLDALAWASTANGYDVKTFEIMEVRRDLQAGRVQVSLREVDPDDHDPPEGLTRPAPPDLRPLRAGVQAVPGWNVEPVEILDADASARRPGILATWTPGEIADARGVRIAMRRAGDTGAGDERPVQAVTAGSAVFEVLPAVTYQARARLVADRLTEWTEWVAVTAPDIRLGAPDLSDEVQDALTEAMLVRDAANTRADEVLATASQAVADLRAAAEAAIGNALEDVGDPLLDRVSALDVDMASRIEDIERIDRDLELSAPRQIDVELAVDTLAERLGWLTLQLSQTRTDMADAGIYIDPELGRARIEAVARIDGAISEVGLLLDALAGEISLRATYADVLDVVTEAQLSTADLPVITSLVGRVSNAELILSGQAGAIALKADTVTLDGVTARVTDAELALDTLADEIALRVTSTELSAVEARVSEAEVVLGTLDVPSLTLAVSDARTALEITDDLASGLLRNILEGRATRELAQADIAFARQDMTAQVDEARTAIASLTTEVGVAVAGTVALVKSESTVRATETFALAQRADDLVASIAGVTAALSEVNRIEADSDSAAARALRQLQLDLGVVSGEVVAQLSALSALTGRVEVTETGLEAEARDRQILQVRIGDAEDDLATEGLRALLADREARRLARQEVADARTDIWAQVDENRQAVAGQRAEFTAALGKATALITAERVARSTALEAEARERLELRADLEETAAGLVSETTTRATQTGALAQRTDALEAAISDPETGLAATAEATELLTTRVEDTEDGLESAATAILSLQSSVNNPTTGLAATTAKADALIAVVTTPTTGLAAQTSLLQAQVNDPTTGLPAVAATVDAQQTALATIEGRAEATFALRLRAGVGAAALEIVAADDPISGPASAIRLAADTFTVNGFTFLEDTFIEKLIARQAFVDDLRVDTLMIKGGAVTIPVHVDFPARIPSETGAGVGVAFATIARQGFATVISFGCQIDGPNYGAVQFSIKRAGVEIRRLDSGTGPLGASQSVFVQFADPDAGSGVTTYRVDAIWIGGARPRVAQRSLSLVQIKR
jgi:hypothetical protein